MTLDFLRQGLPGPRNGRAREVLDWVDRGADSMLETLARTCFRQAGIRVDTQVYIDGVGYPGRRDGQPGSVTAGRLSGAIGGVPAAFRVSRVLAQPKACPA
ncbi:hypothetical protein [Arthrobacter sp. PM3]|uniref:hypothetical protein n=1 Tax=Arthrobacter sp. PM3 TaxID=2017685 RepID=UPI0021C2B1B7|nr:hypothetical protein [Arthrobacter sp. PM3]